MAKTTNDEGGPVVIDLTESRFERVHGGKATPEEAKRYFENRVKPAWDARHEIVSDRARGETTTKKEEGAMSEQLYERWLREQAAGGTATATTDMTNEDAAFEAFAEQSGLNDLTGREPGTREPAADLSAPTDRDAGTDAADAGEEAMWNAFVEQSGSGWMFGETGAAAADMTERVQADKQAESMREQAEADELHESLRRQSHEDHFGAAGDMSDEAAWAAYQRAIGEGQGG